jgi:hypothetical protein
MDPANNLRPPSERTYGLEHVAVGADVRVSALSLVGDECVAWHWHTHASDIFFSLKARPSSKLTIRATPCSSLWATDMTFCREFRIVSHR